jgi:LuxR family transcriptional regulator, maltose regulon positive regulatory protein
MKNPSASVAKITRPNAAHIFPRERLFQLLDKGTKKAVLWISAPAGSGKTSLVSSWLDSRDYPCIWYQADASDQDAATLFCYLRQADARVNPRKQRSLPLFTSDYLQDVASFTRRYFEELFKRMTLYRSAGGGTHNASVFVLDDYQEVPQNSVFHELLQQALEVIPEGITFIVISRGVAPPRFARLRANNRMSLMGWSELRLSAEESHQILRLNGMDEDRPAISRQLHLRADGWAAGLILMMGMSGLEGAGTGLPPEQTQEEVFDYFAYEIFKTSDEQIRSFLLKTAFAPFMTGTMAEQLTGMEHAGRILAELSRNNYFTDWRSGATPVYQYHPLFRDFLRQRARRMLSPEQLQASLQATASVLLNAGYLTYAMELFAEARDFAALCGVIVANAQQLVEQGRSKTLWQWLCRLPQEAFAGDPWLCYWRGVCLHPADIDASLDSYSEAFHGFVARDDKVGALLAWTGVGINIITQWKDFSRLDRQITWLTPDIERQIELLPPDLQARVLGVILLSFSFRQPWHPNVTACEERACALIRGNVPSLESLLLLGSYLLIHYTKMGFLDKARVLIEVIEPRTGQKEIEVDLGLILWRMLSSSYYGLTARKLECLEGLTRGLALSADTGLQVYDIFMLFYGALSGFIDLDGKTIERYLDRIAAVQGAPGLIYPIVHRQILGWKQMVEGDYQSALEHVEAALELTLSHGAPIEIAINVVARAQLLFALGRRDEAAGCIGEVARGNATHSAYILYMLQCTLASFAFAGGDERAGAGHLREAMSIGSSRRILMHHFWTPGLMAPLCSRAFALGIEPEYVKELIARHQLMPSAALANSLDWPWTMKIYTLGRFEIEMQGERLQFTGKKQEKPLSLLKALIIHGERGAHTDTLCDLLWPTAEGDAAHSSLKMALSRLRRLLGDSRLIELKDGRLTMNRQLCWVDAWALEEMCEKGQAALFFADGEAPDADRRPLMDGLSLVDRAIRVYGGEFLHDEKTEFWELAFRDRLQRAFLKLVKRAGAACERAQHFKSALDYYLLANAADHLAEECYQRLMVCHDSLGQKAEAAEVYRLCRSRLQSALGAAPSPQTEEIYRSIGAD